jgi:transposase
MNDSASEPSREDLIAALRAENAALKARIAELERRFGLNSSNSGKPPSSDGLKKPPRVRSLRERSGKKPGGQKGHKGETLRQVANPDIVVDHYPSACADCGDGLDAATSIGHSVRQVFDLPEPQPLAITEHRAHTCQCAGCGATTRGSFPEGVNAPVQYGTRIQSLVIYLRDLVVGAAVKHMDETGFRVGGKTQWLHIASTVLLTFYRVCARRGSLLANVVGIVVHDHWKPYYTMVGVLHALCNAHHLRELKALVEIEKEDWARQMQRLLRRACHAANLAREREAPLKPSLIAYFERRYDAIVTAGLAFHEAQPPPAPATTKSGAKLRGRVKRRTGHNLLLRLQTRKADTLRFLHDPAVPFTNNEGERDGRMMKLRQKISGGFRSLQGATDFAIVRSFIATARKQGWSVIDALARSPEDLVKSLRLA